MGKWNFIKTYWPLIKSFGEKSKQNSIVLWEMLKNFSQNNGGAAIIGAVAGSSLTHMLSNIGTTKKLEEAQKDIKKSKEENSEALAEIKERDKKEQQLEFENRQLQNQNREIQHELIKANNKNSNLKVEVVQLKNDLKECQQFKNFYKTALKNSWCIWKQPILFENNEKELEQDTIKKESSPTNKP